MLPIPCINTPVLRCAIKPIKLRDRKTSPDTLPIHRSGLAQGRNTSIYHPNRWRNAMSNIRQLRDKTPDSEKITINLGYVDLGRIDLLVQEGFYSNRTDFIRTAIRNQLGTHTEAVSKSIERHTMELGLRDYTRADLESLQRAGEVLHVKVVGLARIAPDVSPDLALATIGSITVLGALQASKEVKAALSDRIF
jgi:Arc/MetJ-type ribon-helix-helix transcriptional regulator